MLNSVHLLRLKKLWRSVVVNLMDATLGLTSHHPREEPVAQEQAIEVVEEEAAAVIEVREMPAPRKGTAPEDVEPERVKREALSQHQIRTKTISVNLQIDNDNYAVVYLYIFIFDV